jgi:hypothetical protein
MMLILRRSLTKLNVNNIREGMETANQEAIERSTPTVHNAGADKGNVEGTGQHCE